MEKRGFRTLDASSGGSIRISGESQSTSYRSELIGSPVVPPMRAFSGNDSDDDTFAHTLSRMSISHGQDTCICSPRGAERTRPANKSLCQLHLIHRLKAYQRNSVNYKIVYRYFRTEIENLCNDPTTSSEARGNLYRILSVLSPSGASDPFNSGTGQSDDEIYETVIRNIGGKNKLDWSLLEETINNLPKL